MHMEYATLNCELSNRKPNSISTKYSDSAVCPTNLSVISVPHTDMGTHSSCIVGVCTVNMSNYAHIVHTFCISRHTL